MIDSHAHINDPAFDSDRAAIIQKTFDAGVNQFVEIACEPQEWQPALDLCKQYAGKVYAAAGVHPIYAKVYNDDFAKELKTVLAQSDMRGIGEIGLDYAWTGEDGSPEKVQQNVFEQMMELAADIKKPIVLHCRKSNDLTDFKAYDDMFAILKNSNFNGGVLHCFSGRKQDAKLALDMGLLIGVNGIISYKRNDDLRQTIKYIGLNNLVLETDCPYLPPQTKRGKRNDPSNIPEIAQYLGGALGIPLEQVDIITTANSKKLFSI